MQVINPLQQFLEELHEAQKRYHSFKQDKCEEQQVSHYNQVELNIDEISDGYFEYEDLLEKMPDPSQYTIREKTK